MPSSASSSFYAPSSPYGAVSPASQSYIKPDYYHEPYSPPGLPYPAHDYADVQNAAPPVPYGLLPQHLSQPPNLNYPYELYQPPASAVQPSSSSSLLLSADMPPRKAVAPPPPAPAIAPSPVRTKFPTARIKRIMQADEEVGKVAQQTPIAVGKALELFMIQLVTKSADVAKDKGSKRVTASMLKHVVEADEQWDFLRDIVSRVENEKEGSKAKAKAESETDEEMEEPKKRGRGGGRRKKVQ